MFLVSPCCVHRDNILVVVWVALYFTVSLLYMLNVITIVLTVNYAELHATTLNQTLILTLPL